MIVLDTNVISALMRAERERVVVGWLDGASVEPCWTTAITILEVASGLALLPDGRRRAELEREFGNVVEVDLQGRVLDFDRKAAEAAAELIATARRAGRALEIRDAQIAGIVTARRATLATRNTRDFAPLGVATVDPWTA